MFMDESVCMHEDVCEMNTKREKRVHVEKQQKTKEQENTTRVLATEVARLPTVHLIYDGVHIRARVDSCAGRTIVGGKLAKKVKKQPARNVAVVKAVCGTLIPIRYQTRVSMEAVEVARMKFDALVMEQCDEDLLIGADILHAAKCIMDFGKKYHYLPSGNRRTSGDTLLMRADVGIRSRRSGRPGGRTNNQLGASGLQDAKKQDTGQQFSF